MVDGSGPVAAASEGRVSSDVAGAEGAFWRDGADGRVTARLVRGASWQSVIDGDD